MLNPRYVACPISLLAYPWALKCGPVLVPGPWERAVGEALGPAVGEQRTASLIQEGLSDFAWQPQISKLE